MRSGLEGEKGSVVLNKTIDVFLYGDFASNEMRWAAHKSVLLFLSSKQLLNIFLSTIDYFSAAKL